ncbi:low-density lipoprotein receptor-like [Mya arenaria]|uniref:low-density lipoprotein receptor-like n=1 Tax=Mya arenaria TaxID=6604 RepID=UPI0022E2137F|nr:low-density lipoprotein receptor-like [Mya arenaria]
MTGWYVRKQQRELLSPVGILVKSHDYTTHSRCYAIIQVYSGEYKCESQYACTGTDLICIEKDWTCDGSKDCPEGDDERDCDRKKKIQCDENHFACSNGTGPCVNKLWVCDWEFDCFDASDESPEQGCESNACEKDEFKCGNSKCVQMAFYCDTDDDCGDMSDEPQGCGYVIMGLEGEVEDMGSMVCSEYVTMGVEEEVEEM